MRRGSAQTVRLAPKKRLPPQLELPGGDRFTLRRLLIRASGPGQPHEDGQGGTPEDRTENQHRGREQASVGTVIVTMLLLRHAANVVVLSLVQ